jgi:hypothetical protein
VTSNHVLGLEVVLPDGSVTQLGNGLAESQELDLRGAFIGSEGTLGIATAITLRLLRAPECVNVLLADFETMEAAGEAVRAVTAAGLLPAGMEIMDNVTINAVNDFFGYDEYPRDAAAVLLIELDGQEAEVRLPLHGLSSCAVGLVLADCVEPKIQPNVRCFGKGANPRSRRWEKSPPPTTCRTVSSLEAAFRWFWRRSNDSAMSMVCLWPMCSMRVMAICIR